MINLMLKMADFDTVEVAGRPLAPTVADHASLARAITLVERGEKFTLPAHGGAIAPVLGITGTGGAGKSSLTDELLLRFSRDFPEKHGGCPCSRSEPSKERRRTFG